ncbi:ABC transporter ATP-binding protein [Candidatus Poriferisocius sp.]|uniref:ABC transporter ATP-binding protein n=1 Tax=Candidatus Poriferisocius sp. TaxID=3101276 RepID=UPI003B01FE12
MTRLESMRERAAATTTAARRSLVWMLLARQRGPVRAVLALIVLNSILTLMIAQAVVNLVDNGIVDQAAPIGPYVSHIAKLALLALIVGFASRQMTARIGYQLEYDLRAWLYTRVQWADLRMPKQMATGQLVTRSMTDLKMVQRIIQFLPSIVTLVPATIALLVYLAYLSPPLAVIAFLALPLNLWFLSKFRVRLWGLSWAELNERAEVATAIDEPVRGVRVMRAFGREEHERERLGATALRAYRYSMTRVRLLARYDILLKAVPLLINALVLVAGAQLIAADQLSVGVFLVTFQVAGYVIAIAQILDELASSWQFLRTAQSRLAEVLSLGARPTEGRPAASRFESVELRDARVSFEGTPVIDRLSFEARPGQLVVVNGPPGSGKTTLAGLVGGLVEPTSGEVLLDGRPLGELDVTTIRTMVRIVAEDPVLFSGSLRQNLDLGAAWTVSDDEINAALYAAGADDIVAGMPDGLSTHVGDRGLTLSGGQRQRLALARALVARPRVIVLDDALSAVNPSHEMEIIRRVAQFLPETAIVAITRRPGPATMADSVVQLGRPGATTPPAPAAAPAAAPEQPGTGEAASELMDVVHSLEVSEEAPIVSDAQCRVDAMPRVRWLVGITLFTLLAVLILLVVNSLAGLGPEILFAEATDSAVDGETRAIYGIGLAVVAIGVVFAVSGYFVRVLSMKIAQSIGYLLRRRIFHRLTNLGIDFYDSELPGEVATRVVNDLDTILGFVGERLFRFISSLGRFTVGIVVVIVLVPQLTPVIIGITALILALTAGQLYLGMRAFNRARDDLGRTVATFEEHFAGRSELRGCGAVDKANRRFVEDAWELRQSRRWATSIANLYSELVAFITHVGGALILWGAGHEVLAGTVAVGTALSARLVAQQALQPLSYMSSIYTELLEARVSWNRLAEPFDTPILPAERPDATQAGPLAGDVTFESVAFAYPHTTRPVLDDISFTLPAGAVTCLVGFTGAGKSSITKLLARIYDPTAGRVLAGGVDIADYESRSYRRRLGIVPQDAFLFKGTISSNIAYSRPDASLDEIDRAVRAIGAHDVLTALDGGYEHPVDEEARNLTAAQRQLVALARVWLARPDILVLDEATSSLDGPMEDRVLEAIRALGVTTLTVTHRQNVAQHSDLAIVLEAGRVVEIGSPDELIGTGSAYDRLWAAVDDDSTEVSEKA